jgi:hypothetical protein
MGGLDDPRSETNPGTDWVDARTSVRGGTEAITSLLEHESAISLEQLFTCCFDIKEVASPAFKFSWSGPTQRDSNYAFALSAAREEMMRLARILDKFLEVRLKA